jgi:hypothetical protein
MGTSVRPPRGEVRGCDLTGTVPPVGDRSWHGHGTCAWTVDDSDGAPLPPVAARMWHGLDDRAQAALRLRQTCDVSRAALVAEIARRGFVHAGVTSPGVVVAPAPANGDNVGVFTFPKEFVLPEWRLETLPPSTAFVEDLARIAGAIAGNPVLLVPPFGSRALLRSAGSHLASLDLHESASVELAEALTPGSVAAVLLPATTIIGQRGRKARFAIFSRARPTLVTFVSGLPHVHTDFLFALVHIRPISDERDLLRVFAVPHHAGTDEVLGDLDDLLRMQGGRSLHGYVVRDDLPVDESLAFERHDPRVLGRRDELRSFGPLRRLADVVVSIEPSRHSREHLVASDLPGAVPVLSGRSIGIDGSLDLTDVREWVRPEPALLLQPGDIVLRAIVGDRADGLRLAEVHSSHLPLALGRHVIGLRPTSLDEDARAFLIAFLRSPRAFELMRAEGATMPHLSPRHVLNMDVPIPDPALAAALRELNLTAQQFDHWRREAQSLARSVFTEGRADEARLRVLQSGEIVRQRARAAALMDDASYRIRSRYPFPIAYRWRTVEAEASTTDPIWVVVECAEALLCYAAHVALLFGRVAGSEVKWLETIRTRLRQRNQGTNLGDWIAILSEVRDSREFRVAPNDTPFAEIRDLLRDDDVAAAQRRLKTIRDNRAHARAAAPADRAAEIENSLADLGLLLDASGFLADYALTYVAATQWDSLRGRNRVTIRELMGDDSIVPPAVIESEESTLESNSLYLADRSGRLHLMRPLLVGDHCPACGNWSTFHLDKYDARSSVCTLKSLEHGHAMQRNDLVDAYRAVGLLS